jgi:hypothetical protein
MTIPGFEYDETLPSYPGKEDIFSYLQSFYNKADLRQYIKVCNKCKIMVVMVLNATFNNISVISWRSVLLVEETGVPGENHQPAVSH